MNLTFARAEIQAALRRLEVAAAHAVLLREECRAVPAAFDRAAAIVDECRRGERELSGALFTLGEKPAAAPGPQQQAEANGKAAGPAPPKGVPAGLITTDALLARLLTGKCGDPNCGACNPKPAAAAGRTG